MKIKRHRIVTDKYCGYEVQVKWLFWPFWVMKGFSNTHSTIEAAKEFIKEPKVVWEE